MPLAADPPRQRTLVAGDAGRLPLYGDDAVHLRLAVEGT